METGMFFIRDGLPNSSKRKPQSSFLFYVQVKLPLPPQDGEVRGTEGNHRRLTDCLQPPEGTQTSLHTASLSYVVSQFAFVLGEGGSADRLGLFVKGQGMGKALEE